MCYQVQVQTYRYVLYRLGCSWHSDRGSYLGWYDKIGDMEGGILLELLLVAFPGRYVVSCLLLEISDCNDACVRGSKGARGTKERAELG